MYRIKEMKDCEGNIVKEGDYVQLTEGKASFINKAMKKGFVFKISYIENRPLGNTDYHVAFLTTKGDSNRIYSNGVNSYEIKKVNYDLKKRKIIS